MIVNTLINIYLILGYKYNIYLFHNYFRKNLIQFKKNVFMYFNLVFRLD